MDPASIQVKCPHLRHLYLISSGSIDDSQWLHFGGSEGFHTFLSVRLHFRHLWFTMYSFSFAIVTATLMSFFNLSYVSNSFSGAFADVDEVLKHHIAVLRVVYFWMELEAESVPPRVLHPLDFA